MTENKTNFDPNGPACPDAGLFGLSYQENDAALILCPVPWEATVSFGKGTARGPRAILRASHQLDLFDLELGPVYQAGIHMRQAPEDIRAAHRKVEELVDQWRMQSHFDCATSEELRSEIDALCQGCKNTVQAQVESILDLGKIPGIIGGEHAVSLGAYLALGKTDIPFGILQIDAHSDTRDAYEGLMYSHASVMKNALEEVPTLSHLSQVGVRDICEEEMALIEQSDRVTLFSDPWISGRKMEGDSFAHIADEICRSLPENVWVSLDIDGLVPNLCPNTGTPVPGGLEFDEVSWLLKTLVEQKKRILGFDLVEVAPGDGPEGQSWDANVGMRLLYKLCGWALASQSKLTPLSQISSPKEAK